MGKAAGEFFQIIREMFDRHFVVAADHAPVEKV